LGDPKRGKGIFCPIIGLLLGNGYRREEEKKKSEEDKRKRNLRNFSSLTGKTNAAKRTGFPWYREILEKQGIAAKVERRGKISIEEQARAEVVGQISPGVGLLLKNTKRNRFYPNQRLQSGKRGRKVSVGRGATGNGEVWENGKIKTVWGGGAESWLRGGLLKRWVRMVKSFLGCTEIA